MLKQLTWGLQRLCLASPVSAVAICRQGPPWLKREEEEEEAGPYEESFQLLISQKELCRLLGLC